MKRFFFSLIALSAAAIGCTQSAMLESPGLNGTEISFNPYTGRTPMTKATEITTPQALGVLGFKVLGYLNGDKADPYMNNRTVTSEDGLAWTYGSPVLYWPDKDSPSSLSFVAYSANATNYIQWSAEEGKENTTFTYSVPDNVNDQVDLLATAIQKDLTLNSSSDKVSSTGQVKLNFHHLLSRIGFSVYGTQDKSDRFITIKSLRL